MKLSNFYSLPLLVASDHAGFELKQQLIKHQSNILWKDLGCFNINRTDYPDWAQKLCLKIQTNEQENIKGLLICGTGQGMAMQANRFKAIRASLCWNKEIALLARSHNNSNVLCLPARFLKLKQASDILDIFLKTNFKNTVDYQRRIKKMSD